MYTYTYDKANRLTAIDLNGSGQATYSAYEWQRPGQLMLPGGTKRNFTYSPFQELDSLTALDPGGNPIQSATYSYSDSGQVKTRATEHGDYVYDYDNLYRLTEAQNPNSDTETFTYDPLGNRETGAGIDDWLYNPNNELESYGATSFIYDDNGNMTSKSVDGQLSISYEYGVDNRLEKAKDGQGAEIGSYYYDPFGRRLWKEVGGTRTYFHYSDEGLVGEYDAAGVEIKTFGYKPASTWTTDPLFMKVGTEYYFYQNDHLGTPQMLTSVNGTVVWRAVYDAFGKAEVDLSSTVVNPLRFPGQYWDEETGLHYNWHRYYDPSTGRYLTADPIGLAGGINLYAYVGGNPVNAIDPRGLEITGSWERNLSPGNVKIGFNVANFRWDSELSSDDLGGYRFGYLPVYLLGSIGFTVSCKDDCPDREWDVTRDWENLKLHVGDMPVSVNGWPFKARILNTVRKAVNTYVKEQGRINKFIDLARKAIPLLDKIYGMSPTAICKLFPNG